MASLDRIVRHLMNEEVIHREDEEVCSKQREQQVQRPRSRGELGRSEEQEETQCD